MQNPDHAASFALDLALRSHGVLHRGELRAVGIDRFAIRRHLRGGRWTVLGPNTLRNNEVPWCSVRSPIVAAVWESGRHACADGVSSLILAGLRHWEPATIEVSVPRGMTPRAMDGVTHRYVTLQARTLEWPAPRVDPHVATVRAASWAQTDRAAATILSMSVQQRLVHAPRLADVLALLPRIKRRRLLDELIGDIASGSESIGELDFVKECRRRGIPLPERQVIRRSPRGHFYLDVHWPDAHLTVEVDGAHHYAGENPSLDALRQNELAIGGDMVLRIPRVALRVDPEPYFEQIARALGVRRPRAA